MPFGETIAAAATPAGESALAVVRASGPLVPALAAAVLGRAEDDTPPPRFATVGNYHAGDGAILDQVVVTRFAAPASYTGEDLLEISCHGNPLIVRKILGDLFARGCRPAHPGEFTRTAFANGKLDLSQAEAVADLIRARSDGALRMAQRQLDGDLSRRVQEFSNSLMQILAEVEAYIDFPEEDLPTENPQAPRARLEALRDEIGKLLATARYGGLLRDGVNVVIVGPPNAGKSSLLNALLGRPRAIVSPEPGTTRDFIEERFMAGPYSIQIVDTAGLRTAAPDSVEAEGIARTMEKIASADFYILIFDSTTEPTPLPSQVLSVLRPSNTIVVENKTDLSDSRSICHFFVDYKHVRLSATTGIGLPEFHLSLIASLESGYSIPNEDFVLTSLRHVESLSRAQSATIAAISKIAQCAPTELLASDLRQALEAFGEIVGQSDNEAMLDRLFEQFCIGK